MVPSFAKINLGLRVLGKRSDGFHEIETLFQTISLHDNIDIHVQDSEITFDTSSNWCPSDDSNLVVKAARLLKKNSGTSLGCKINLVKNIPSGAGLGGGSSNAATTLRALNCLWNTGYDDQELGRLAASLGSDIPFFIKGGTALGTGRGEKLEQITIQQNYWGLLICPLVHISTPWAYQQFNFSLTKSFKSCKFSVFSSQSVQFEQWQDLLVNDFEPIVFSEHPELENIPISLTQAGAFYSSMSGSGSSFFGLFDNEETAQRAHYEMGRQYKNIYLFRPVYRSDR